MIQAVAGGTLLKAVSIQCSSDRRSKVKDYQRIERLATWLATVRQTRSEELWTDVSLLYEAVDVKRCDDCCCHLLPARREVLQELSSRLLLTRKCR